MAVIKTKGIVIRKNNLAEADKILTLITKDRGKIRVVAKGVRKHRAKLSGFLDLFHYNEYLIAEGRNLDIITGASTIESWPNISLNLKRVALAYYISETVDKLIEETQDIGNLFDLIYFIFRAINQEKANLDVLKAFFEINLAEGLGFRPELDKCIECDEPVELEAWFSFVLGGVLDSKHQFSDPLATKLSKVDLESLRNLRVNNVDDFYLVNEISQISPQVIAVTSGFLNHIVDQKIKSQDFLAEMVDF